MPAARDARSPMARRTARRAIAAAMLATALFCPAAASAADPGITGQWHFDTTAGSGASSTTEDASGGGQTGKFTTTPTLVAGRFGKALSGPWMNVPRPAAGAWSLESANVSFTAWIKQAGFPGLLRYIAGKGALGPFPTCGGSSWGMYTGYSGKAGLTFYVKDAVGGGTLSPQLGPSSSVWDGNWHAVTGTYDGAAVRLYVDGAQVGTGTPTTTPILYTGASPDNFTLGTYPDKLVGAPCGIADWPGPIDEARVHNRALTQAEITKLHDPTATTPPTSRFPPASSRRRRPRLRRPAPRSTSRSCPRATSSPPSSRARRRRTTSGCTSAPTASGRACPTAHPSRS